VEVLLHAFLTSLLDGGEWLASRVCTPEERTSYRFGRRPGGHQSRRARRGVEENLALPEIEVSVASRSLVAILTRISRFFWADRRDEDSMKYGNSRVNCRSRWLRSLFFPRSSAWNTRLPVPAGHGCSSARHVLKSRAVSLQYRSCSVKKKTRTKLWIVKVFWTLWRERRRSYGSINVCLSRIFREFCNPTWGRCWNTLFALVGTVVIIGTRCYSAALVNCIVGTLTYLWEPRHC
jgi:hypothetical protein